MKEKMYKMLSLLMLLLVMGCHGDPPNIILILTDDLGFGDISVSEYRLRPPISPHILSTPNIKALGDQGAIFARAYSEPLCSPARFSLLSGVGTGRSPVRGNNGGKKDFRLAEGMATYGTLLQSRGYRTGLFGKWGFDGYPDLFGFDKFYGLMTHLESHSCFPAYIYKDRQRKSLQYNARNLAGNGQGRRLDCTIDSLDQRSKCDFMHDLVVEQSLAFIEENAREKFFMQISFTAPHVCSWDSKMKNPYPLVSVAPFGDFGNCPLKVKGQRMTYMEQNECRFKSLVENYLDRSVGEIVAKTRELGIEDNTVIVFTTDNGPVEEERVHSLTTFDSIGGYRGGKRTVYEAGIKIPLIVKWPKMIPKKRVVTEPVMLYDLYATFVQLADNDYSSESLVLKDSISLVPAMLGKSKRQVYRKILHIEFCEQQGRLWKKIKRRPEKYCSYMVMGEQYKMIYDHEVQEYKLFDIVQDPYETTNLAKSHANLLQEMREQRINTLFVSLKDAGYRGGVKLPLV